jgi:hypothetical protein
MPSERLPPADGRALTRSRALDLTLTLALALLSISLCRPRSPRSPISRFLCLHLCPYPSQSLLWARSYPVLSIVCGCLFRRAVAVRSCSRSRGPCAPASPHVRPRHVMTVKEDNNVRWIDVCLPPTPTAPASLTDAAGPARTGVCVCGVDAPRALSRSRPVLPGHGA